MRKTATSFLAVGLLLAAFASAATAGSIFTENFTYPDGQLTPNNSWAVSSGTISGSAPDIQIVSNRAVGSGNSSPDDHRLFTPVGTTASTYMCFDVIIGDPGGAPRLVYFALLKDAGAANLVARIYVVPLTSGGWTFAISNTSTNATTSGITLWSLTSLNFDQQYRIVAKYDPVASTSTLWVDPTDESSPSVSNTNAAFAAVNVQGVGLRQSNSASTVPPSPDYGAGSVNWPFSVDNLSVGISMIDACDGITPTEKSTWGRLKAIYR